MVPIVPRSRQSQSAHILPAVSHDVCPAKTWLCPTTGKVLKGRSVFDHCLSVGEVARALLARLPQHIQSLFPFGAVLVAACHDIGKVSPTFYEKLRRACADSLLQPLPDIEPSHEKQWGGHAGVSLAAVMAMKVSPLLAEALGQHHGFRPNVGTYTADAEVFGGAAWQAEREQLVQALKEALHTNWPPAVSTSQARLLAGLTSVADWIGSGPLFENPDHDWRPLIHQALDEAGLVPPKLRHGLSFADIFGFAPRDLQHHLAQQVSGPGVYILEAPMGQGKTEAALYTAYRLLAAGLAHGVYFALPTQLTSNKLYDRLTPFLQTILQPNCIHRQGLLLHGQAWLLQANMGEEGRPGGDWFHHAKRGLLAPFAVGTVDQALMAVMNVKHSFVRAFGLAGKVVILDEVHSYDIYTGTILQQLISQLRDWGCTVIILSATLTKTRREQLLQLPVSKQDYPLISALPLQARTVQEIETQPPAPRSIAIKLHAAQQLTQDEALKRAMKGEQVLWVENSVADAQRVYQVLAARAADAGIACGLLHSRFTRRHRQRNENDWVLLFGKEGWAQRSTQGRILVGTQVLEQSLDIDADFLISRFAPTDLVLQRLGRLWRHEQTPRAASARCEAWLLAPDLAPAIADPYTAFSTSAAIYSPYVLCRSLQSWQGVEHISLPQDIRPLIESSYALQEEKAEMARWLQELERGRTTHPYPSRGVEALQRLAQATLATSGTTQPDTAVATRYSEQDTQDVLLLRHIRLRPNHTTELTLLDGRSIELPQQRHRLSPTQWRQLSIDLQHELVSLRPTSAPPPSKRQRLEQLGLQHVFFLGLPEWDDATLRVALVDEQDRVTTLDGSPISDKHHYRYRDDLGYQRLSTKD